MSRARDLANVADDVSTGTVVTTASPSLGRRNLIINGAMQVAQRGTGAVDGDNKFSVDRLKQEGSSNQIRSQQQTLSSSDSPWDYGLRYYTRFTNITNATATNTYRQASFNLEAQDMATSGWNYTSSSSDVTVSFWVRSSLAGTYYFDFLTSDGTTAHYVTSYTLSADTWTKVTKTIPGYTGITFNNDNGLGLRLVWRMYLGSNYTDSGRSLETWAAYSSSSITPEFLQNWANTTNATFDLTGVQLEVGSVATPFEHRSYGEELALCQRYYQVLVEGAEICIAVGHYYASGVWHLPVQFMTEMRATPSLDVASGNDYYRIEKSGSDSLDDFLMARQGKTSALLYNNSDVSGGTAGQAFETKTINAASFIAVKAEL